MLKKIALYFTVILLFSVWKANAAWKDIYDQVSAVYIENRGSSLDDSGFIDYNGSFKVTNFIRIRPSGNFSEGLVRFSFEDGTIGYLNKMLGIAIDPQFSWATQFREGKAAVWYKGLSGYIDKTGELIYKVYFDYAAPFSDGMSAFMLNTKIGYVNSYGEIAIPPKFDAARGFSEGFAAVCIKGKWGFIDKTGNFVF